MGLISSIRKRLWLVTILMALALLGFIVMDMTTGNSGSLFSNSTTLGKVAGKSLDWNDFQRREGIMYQNSTVDYYGRKEYLWEQFVEGALLDKEAKNNGLGVSDAEMEELQFGANLSPVVERNFRDPNSGQVNREQLSQFKTGLEGGQLPQTAKDFWEIQKGEVKKDRMHSKLGNLIEKSLYLPTFMIQRYMVDGNTKMELLYSYIPYSEVKDDEIKVSDEEIKSYLQKNPSKFKTTEETRDIAYAVIDIIPTSEDSSLIRNLLVDKKKIFETIKTDSSFVVTNLGTWDEKLYKKSELDPENANMIFGAAKGTVVGPYIEKGEMRIAKVLDKKLIPDSVKSRHILYRVTTQAEANSGRRLMDSLKTVLDKKQASFTDLARQFSQDPGSSPSGGDLGYAAENRMVKPFNDLIFYKAEKGKYYVIASQFGFHLVEVTDFKYITNSEGVRLGIIAETIQPGEEITDNLFNKASDIIQQNRTIESFKKAIETDGKYKIEIEPQVNKSAFKIVKFGEGASSTVREIARWLFNSSTKVGDVSPEVFSLQDEVKKFTNKYVIAAYSAKNAAGTPSLEKVKTASMLELMNEKKYNKIKESISAGSEISNTYGPYTAQIDTTKDANLYAGVFNKLENEHETLVEVSKNEVGKIIGPLKGTNGVYMVKILNKIPPFSLDPSTFKRFYTHPAKNVAITYCMEALKKKEKIKDSRSKFY